MLSLQSSKNELILPSEYELQSIYETNGQIRDLCTISENDECVDFILNRIKTDLDLKTVQMLLKTIQRIKAFYLENGKVLSKQELAYILHKALTNSEFRKSCIEKFTQDQKKKTIYIK